MEDYSLRKNLKYMGMAFTKPNLLIRDFLRESSIWYGIVPFILSILVGWLTAYFIGDYQAVNPLPKILPIPDSQYPLYQAVFGPFIKAAGIFIFGGSIMVFAKWLRVQGLIIVPIVVFFIFIWNTVGLLAIAVDQLIVWGPFEGAVRFGLSTIHPIALIIVIAYVIAFVRRYADITLWKTILLVVPSIILAFPLPGILFR